MNNNDPTILVKKADGTAVRMTLDELKKMKSKGGQKQSPVTAKEFPKPPILKVREIKPRKRQDTKAMFSSLQKEAGRLSPLKRENSKILNTQWENKDHQSLLDEPFGDDNDLPVPVKENEHRLSGATPVKDLFVDEAKYQKSKDAKSSKESYTVTPVPTESGGIHEVPEKEYKPTHLESKVDLSIRPLMSLSKSISSKPTIDDVKPPKVGKQTVGPVEELESFSVADFRRLGVNMEAMENKLIEKFKTLKHDSYLRYMDGVKAWYNSPIYARYQDIISESLKQNKTLDVILREVTKTEDLKKEEFMVILRLNKTISQ